MRDPLVIDATPPGRNERALRWLRGRRLMLSGVLALVEVVAFLIWQPSPLLLAMAALVVLVASVLVANRLKKGLARTVLWIVAIAQGLVVVIPLVVGLSLVAGLLIAVVLIVALIGVAMRWRI